MEFVNNKKMKIVWLIQICLKIASNVKKLLILLMVNVLNKLLINSTIVLFIRVVICVINEFKVFPPMI